MTDYIKEVLACHEMLWRLGFSAGDEVFVNLAQPPGDPLVEVGVLLRTQGKEFVAGCGSSSASFEEIKAEWKEACAWWNKLPDAEREPFLNSTIVRQNAVDFTMAILSKGIVMPRKPN